MQPKDLLLKTLRHETVEQAPWVPFAGVHAGKLIGCDAETILKDDEKLCEALLQVNKLYKPCGQPVVFDLQIEAEILGCGLVWTKDGPPSVKTHPLEAEAVVPEYIPGAGDGRLPMILKSMRRMKREVGETTALYGLICGPFTLASHLRGNDIFMDMFDDEDYVKALLAYCANVGKRIAELYIEAGTDVIAVVDPLVSQVSAAHFEEFMSEPFTALFDSIRSLDKFSAFFVCGDATRNIEVMCKTSPDSICVDENVNIIKAKEITDSYNVVIGGNIPLTSIMLHGTQQDNMKYVVELFDTLDASRNFIVAPGCDMPYAVPVENGIAVAQAVWQTAEVREILKNYVAVDETIEVDLPDYTALIKPFVEVFTLDSATCAACTYMMGAANAAKERYGEAIDVTEYKFTLKENIARCKKMGVKNLPSIYINGKLKFSSLIPSPEELDTAINAAIADLKGTC